MLSISLSSQGAVRAADSADIPYFFSAMHNEPPLPNYGGNAMIFLQDREASSHEIAAHHHSNYHKTWNGHSNCSNFPDDNSANLCGDGVCNEVEKIRGLCPKDCDLDDAGNDDNVGDSSLRSSEAEHHFGMYSSSPNSDDIDESFEILKDLGIKEISYFNREGLHSAQLDGNFDKFDEIYHKVLENGMNIMPWVRARDHSDCTELDSSEMTDYLAEVIERYPEIKEWKILKESDQPCRDSLMGGEPVLRLGSDVGITADTNPSMVELASLAKETLKAKCPDCKLVFGGFGPDADEEYYNSLVESDFYNNFDVLGLLGYQWFHLNFRPDKSKNEYIIQSSINPQYFDETDVAKGTVKLFTYYFSIGFDRIYYEQIFDFGDENNFWGSRGLITQDNRKKEVYYSFKTLINQLEGFKDIEIISACDEPADKIISSPPGGKCYYKFNFDNKDSVYVLWCDEDSCDIPSELPDELLVIDYLGNELLMNKEELKISGNPLFIKTGSNSGQVCEDLPNCSLCTGSGISQARLPVHD